MMTTDCTTVEFELSGAVSLLGEAPTADDCSDAINFILADAAMYDGDDTALRALLATF